MRLAAVPYCILWHCICRQVKKVQFSMLLTSIRVIGSEESVVQPPLHMADIQAVEVCSKAGRILSTQLPLSPQSLRLSTAQNSALYSEKLRTSEFL